MGKFYVSWSTQVQVGKFYASWSTQGKFYVSWSTQVQVGKFYVSWSTQGKFYVSWSTQGKFYVSWSTQVQVGKVYVSWSTQSGQVLCQLVYSGQVLCQLVHSSSGGQVLCQLVYSGQVLCQLVYSGQVLWAAGIPSVVLDKPRRNTGVVAHACYKIKEGLYPTPDSFEGETSNWTHIEIADDDDILSKIIDIHKRYISIYGIESAKKNLQVISPEKKGVLGCVNLNKKLAEIMNPVAGRQQAKSEELPIKIGDKVVRTKNGKAILWSESDEDDSEDYEYFDGKRYFVSKCMIVNGDIGEVIGVKGQKTIVKFLNPERICPLPNGDMRVTLSYAMTVHKCQGSGFPIVIMPLTNFYWNDRENTGLFSRELIYTSFSRPSERLITVGRMAEAHKAISRITIDRRLTRLKEMVSVDLFDKR